MGVTILQLEPTDMPVWLHSVGRLVLNEHLLKLHGNLWLHLLGVAKYDVSVVCVGKTYMRKLNKQYQNVDQPTDVLSFPFHENLTPGSLPRMEQGCDLGDVFLCVPVIAEQCCGKHSLQDRLAVITAHGLLHLLGYSHFSTQRWREMHAKEVSLLKSFNNAFGANLKPLTEQHHLQWNI